MTIPKKEESPIVYSDKAEIDAAVHFKKSFVFDDNESEPFVVLLQGEEGTGKTHLASTVGELGLPVYFLDTEQRAKLVTKKFNIANVKITRSFLELWLSVKAIIDNFPKGIIVIDSATDIQKFAEFRHLEEQGKQKVGKPYQWGEVFEKIELLFNTIKSAGFHIILTSRMTDEYSGETKTGRKIAKIYKDFPYKADVIVQLNRDKTKQIIKPIYGKLSNKIYPAAESITIKTLLQEADIIGE